MLQLANIALARWFAERLRRGDRERAALLRRALDASDLERRRLAADLHDGVVQDLTAVSLSVAAAGRRLDGVADPKTVGELADSAESARQSVGTLRSMLVEVYPPNLAALGLPAALRGLVDAAVARGLDAELEIDERLPRPDGAEALLFRAAQEGLRNAAAHAGADSVTVSRGHGRRHDAWVEVADDGRGFDPDTAARRGGTSACARSATCSPTPAGGWTSRAPRAAVPCCAPRCPRHDPGPHRRRPPARARGHRPAARLDAPTSRWSARPADGEEGARRRSAELRARPRADGPLHAGHGRAHGHARASASRHPASASSCSAPTPSATDVLEALDAGAAGYLLKDAPPEELLAGVRSAARDESPLAPRVAREVARPRGAARAARAT